MRKNLLSLCMLMSIASFAQWASTSIYTTGEECYSAFGKILAADDASNSLVASADNGLSWNSSNSGVPSSGLKFGALNGTTLYAFKNNTIYQSLTGDNWVANNTSAIPSTEALKSMAAVGGTVLAVANTPSGNSKIYQLSGTTWALKSSLPTTIYTIKNLNGTLWAGTTSTLVLKSSDAGLTFINSSGGLAPANWWGKYVYCLGATSSALFFGTYDGKIFKSTDNGISWNVSYNISTGAPFAISDIYVTAGNNIMVACDSGFVSSEDNGVTWKKSNAGFNYAASEYELAKVTASSSHLFVSTKNGKVFRRVSTEIFSSIHEYNTNKITSKACPNPASGSTTIKANDLQAKNNCSVKLIDVCGREISHQPLLNGEAVINLEAFSKGLYTYIVIADNMAVSNGKISID